MWYGFGAEHETFPFSIAYFETSKNLPFQDRDKHWLDTADALYEISNCDLQWLCQTWKVVISKTPVGVKALHSRCLYYTHVTPKDKAAHSQGNGFIEFNNPKRLGATVLALPWLIQLRVVALNTFDADMKYSTEIVPPCACTSNGVERSWHGKDCRSAQTCKIKELKHMVYLGFAVN